MNNTFRTAALALRGYISDTYVLLDAADTVTGLIEDAEAAARSEAPKVSHNMLVAMALGTDEVMDEVRNGKKIAAIKALRNYDNRVIGLKAAKEAVEDSRVMASWDLNNLVPLGDPWSNYSDEPPF